MLRALVVTLATNRCISNKRYDGHAMSLLNGEHGQAGEFQGVQDVRDMVASTVHEAEDTIAKKDNNNDFGFYLNLHRCVLATYPLAVLKLQNKVTPFGAES